jgi:hypothetical protein
VPDQYEMADWLRRVKAEYREMPGLQLTERQMRRLWSLDGATCAVIIAMLVGTGFLIETPRHAYVLAVSHISRP